MKATTGTGLQKAASTASTLVVLMLSPLAWGSSSSAAQDQHLRNQEDPYLSVKDNSYIRSPSEPASLVYREQGGEGSIYERYTAVTQDDIQYIKSLKPGTNYDCRFEDTASYRYDRFVSTYRFLAMGIVCTTK